MESPKDRLLNKEPKKKSRNYCCLIFLVLIGCLLGYLIYFTVSNYLTQCKDQRNCFDCMRATDFCPWCTKCQWCVASNECQKRDATCLNDTSHSNCSFAFGEIEPYNETIARYLLDYAFAAYRDEPQNCLNDTEVYYRAKAQCDFQGGPCIGFIAIDHEKEVLVLSFQGTETLEQLLVQGVKFFGKYLMHGEQGGVMKYYKTSVDALWPCLLPKIQLLHKEYPEYELWITGHSLGGALASVAAFEMVYVEGWDKEKLKLVTFGEPREGNFEYAKEHDDVLPYSWRVVHAKDLVPHIPSCLSFRGNCLLTNTQPYHHGMEVWYPDEMGENSTYTECRGVPHDEDKTCSNGMHYFFKYNIEDHFLYFMKDVHTFCPGESTSEQERIFSEKCQNA